ncbi:MAG TPA: hypothetical protein VHC72_08390, partial [Bryobacteraceae bacterium]|nr:hypothetical protein [Bryobacteraceae bacterium]
MAARHTEVAADKDLRALRAARGVLGFHPYMHRPALVCSILLSCAALAAAAEFRLGLNYAEWGPYSVLSLNQQLGVDSAGTLYILSPCSGDAFSPSCLTKLSADGKTVLWQQNLTSRVIAMAVDPNGGVFLIPGSTGPAVVEKLGGDGMVVWKTQFADGAAPNSGLAADASGRAFVASGDRVTRLSTAGAIDAVFPNAPIGQNISLVVSRSGSDIVIG